ncbi:flagellar protein [Allorhizobium borbori]|nr:flagellar protein [Allorhizobium borbori]PZU18538.1 MAG: flagellar protein [Shinella sp.]
MNDFDADEPVAPLNPKARPKRQARRTDKILALTGIGLAAAAAAFPWYVFFNEEKFGIRIAGWEQLDNLPADSAARRPFAVSTAMPAPENRSMEPNQVDNMVTATVSNLGKEKEKAPPMQESQPMPGRSGFRLLHVANGRALIEDDNGMYMVQVGSILPDETRLATVEKRGGKWVIVTSSGEVYTAPN